MDAQNEIYNFPKKFEDNMFGLLNTCEDEDFEDEDIIYYGTIDLFDGIIEISFCINTYNFKEFTPDLIKNAHSAMEWIRRNYKSLIEETASDYIFKYDNIDMKHPMWWELYQKRLKEVASKLKIMFISFYADEKYSIDFDDGGLYWGSTAHVLYNAPGELDEICISDPEVV